MILPILLTLAVSSPPDPDLPARFAELLERDDRTAIVAATVSGAPTDWPDLIDVVERYDCIDVRAVEGVVEAAGEDTVSVRIELSALGTTTGAKTVTTLLPGVWYVQYARTPGGWRIQSAQTHEHRLALSIMRAPDDNARWKLVREAPAFDFLLMASIFARDLTDDANLPYYKTVQDFVVRLGERSGDLRAESQSWRTLVSPRIDLKDERGASEAARRAVALAEESGDADSMASAYFSDARARAYAGDTEGSLASFRKSADLIALAENPRPSLSALYMAQLTENARGNISQAAQYTERMVVLARKYGWTQGELFGLSAIAVIRNELGDLQGFRVVATEVYRKMLAIGDRASAGITVLNLANAELLEENYELAEQRIQEALSFAAPWIEIPAHLYLARVMMARGSFDAAERELRAGKEKSETAADRLAAASFLMNLSELQEKRGRHEEAFRTIQEVLEIWKDNPAPQSVIWHAHWEPKTIEARLLHRLGRDAEAAAAYEKAIDEIETDRTSVGSSAGTTEFMTIRAKPYFALTQLHARNGNIERALTVSEKLKSRVLNDILAQGSVDLRESLSDEERKREDELNRRLTELNRAVLQAGGEASPQILEARDNARREHQLFMIDLYARYPRIGRTSLPLEEHYIRRWLTESRLVPSEDALVLDYVVGEEETTLFAIARDGARAYTIPVSQKDLSRAIGKLVSRLERRELDYAAASARLYQQLLGPVEKLITTSTKICIVPDGPLWRLPFAVLRAPHGKKHLIERVAIHYAPSLGFIESTAASNRRWLPPGARVLTVGNPTIEASAIARVRAFTRAALGDLPEAEEEARAVGALYGPGRSRVLVREAATEQATKKATPSHHILHFATHGLSNPSQPLYSSLVLASDNLEEDGLLEAREILRMNLSAPLAVLSACETARGRIVAGEGVIGLSWAFLIAGCPRTVVTHWQTDSAAAARAMTVFHRQIASTPGGGSVGDALRNAQLSLLRSTRFDHPYYWAPFVLIGSGW